MTYNRIGPNDGVIQKRKIVVVDRNIITRRIGHAV
jgi:hypothetical protein